jgi:hypothetical protein
MEHAPLLVIHMAARPVDHHKPIPHDEMAAKAKLSTEGALEEQKMIRGWYFDLQQLTTALQKISSLLGQNPSTVCYSLEKQLQKNLST